MQAFNNHNAIAQPPPDDFDAINRRCWSLARRGLIVGGGYGAIVGATLAGAIALTTASFWIDSLRRPDYPGEPLPSATVSFGSFAILGGLAGVIVGPPIGFVVGVLAAKNPHNAKAARWTSTIASALASSLLGAAEAGALLVVFTIRNPMSLFAIGCAVFGLATGAIAGRLLSADLLRAARETR
jgi:hypothetical protein